MNIVFRTDASLQIGTGHVMRCLTLANALREQGAVCTFISREHSGNLVDYIRAQGHVVHVLAVGDMGAQESHSTVGYVYSAWLGAKQTDDIAACRPILESLQPDWLVVDHYSLDASWERALKDCCDQVMVIDDLADRHHECDVLLDQNLGRRAEDYQGLVPRDCVLLIGPRYALIRPEFAALRQYSLSRRQRSECKNLLITMGGVDAPNATGKVLQALRLSSLLADCRITVVMGGTATHLDAIRAQAKAMPWVTDVCVDVPDMARIMAESDICIGAAGGTSWERCCLGLPAIVVVLADNQRSNARALANVGAVMYMDLEDVDAQLPSLVANGFRLDALGAMSEHARTVTEGKGASLVSEMIMGGGGA